MSAPRLESVWFGIDGIGGMAQYPRMARVLDFTAREHNPTWDVRVRQIDPPHVRAKSGATSDTDNAHKLQHWRDIVLTADEGSRILLVDADTFVTGPLDALWDIPFDVAYTTRTSMYPLNAGVVAVRVNHHSRAFFHGWAAQDEAFLHDPEAHAPWRAKYGGMNQASLGCFLESERHDELLTQLPCATWNCEDTTWAAFDPATTRLVHVKSALRMAIFKVAPATPALAPLVDAWLAAEDRLGLALRLEAGA